MESTLFTTLTVSEEASLSGGWYKKHKPATTTPATTTPATTTPAKPTVTLTGITQVNVITDSEDAKATNTITIG